VTALTRSEAVKTGVTVGTQLAGELPRIQGDRVQLQQVMLNLIVNAIQSMSGVEDGNRELHISTVSIEPEGVGVAVRDVILPDGFAATASCRPGPSKNRMRVSVNEC
jgi:C4-dicarboxylate-specific signal transduction histidine kinase